VLGVVVGATVPAFVITIRLKPHDAVHHGRRTSGASAIQCCYAAIEKRQSPTLTDMAESKNTNVTFCSAPKCIAQEKISLNVSLWCAKILRVHSELSLIPM
jgi:hypothetical protein